MKDRTEQIDRLKWAKQHMEIVMMHLKHLELDLDLSEASTLYQIKHAWQACSATFSLIYDVEHSLTGVRPIRLSEVETLKKEVDS